MVKNISKMTLGTVQLGMNYGIANDLGMPDEQKSFSMLSAALQNGVTSLDTARNYGVSELVIGKFLKSYEGELPYITSKIKVTHDEEVDIEKHVITSAEESLERLGLKKVDCFLVHNVKDMFRYGESLAAAMSLLVKKGYADTVGVSVYLGSELDEMFKYPVYSATQIPASIFDQRIIASGHNLRLKERGYTVFVRSVFLQGLFFLDPDKVDDPILLEHAVPKIRLLREIAQSEGMSLAQLAIAFMRDTAGFTSLVLGADTPEQVIEDLAYFEAPPLPEATVRRLTTEFASVDIPEIMKVLSRPKK